MNWKGGVLALIGGFVMHGTHRIPTAWDWLASAAGMACFLWAGILIGKDRK